ncbi:MAG: glucose-1-phosphate thymidylyltransferase [Candidatus Adiutrix sp.]
MWYNPENFFDYSLQLNGPTEIFLKIRYIWEALDHIEPYIRTNIKPNVKLLRKNGDMISKTVALTSKGEVLNDIEYEFKDKLLIFSNKKLIDDAALIMAGAVLCDNMIEIGPGAIVESASFIKGPTIIGPNSEVRQGAYVRGAVMSCPKAVIGHATEAKNTLLLNGAKAGHFAYLGDSILGCGVNLGAGTKLANLKMNENPYFFKFDGDEFVVKRRKFGAIIGDYGETGCNSVTNPGTILAKNAKILPNVAVKAGYHHNHSANG